MLPVLLLPLTLAAYLLSAMTAWTALPSCPEDGARCVSWEKWHHEPAPAARARYEEIAAELAVSGATGTEALYLAAVAFEESGFDRLVDDGTCNSPALVAEMRLPWNCDHGYARSMWQLHDRTVSPDDRPGAIAKALSVYRHSPEAWSAWKWAKPLADRWRAMHGDPSL